jgi:hypothetical protein
MAVCIALGLGAVAATPLKNFRSDLEARVTKNPLKS